MQYVHKQQYTYELCLITKSLQESFILKMQMI